MILGITGSRDITTADELLISEVIASYVQSSSVSKIIFGGALGSDTVALRAALNSRTSEMPYLLVAVPSTLSYQPKSTQGYTAQADEVLEMNLSGSDMYRKRNQYIVSNCTHLVAFWNGDEKSGTAQTIRLARSQGRTSEIYRLGTL